MIDNMIMLQKLELIFILQPIIDNIWAFDDTSMRDVY